jgi:hypothetical protein
LEVKPPLIARKPKSKLRAPLDHLGDEVRDRRYDVGEVSFDRASEETENGDDPDGDDSENQAVLGHRLTLMVFAETLRQSEWAKSHVSRLVGCEEKIGGGPAIGAGPAL